MKSEKAKNVSYEDEFGRGLEEGLDGLLVRGARHVLAVYAQDPVADAQPHRPCRHAFRNDLKRGEKRAKSHSFLRSHVNYTKLNHGPSVGIQQITRNE